jgi:hypothetical protein
MLLSRLLTATASTLVAVVFLQIASAQAMSVDDVPSGCHRRGNWCGAKCSGIRNRQTVDDAACRRNLAVEVDTTIAVVFE